MPSNSQPVKIVLFNGKLAALKSLDNRIIPAKSILKEISIHKSLSHRFISKYMFHTNSSPISSLFLEFAQYSLRSLIAPGIGLNPVVGHLIFSQLLEAVSYLHLQGICHRDIKPENILVTKEGNIKLTDFGHSTLYRDRRLKSLAGTVQFMAPEVFKGDYNGARADIFSMGITLLNILTGTLPWENATSQDEKYKAYRQMKYHCYDPFKRLRESVLRLIEEMLQDEPERISLENIKEDVWMKQENRILGQDNLCQDCSFLDGIEENEGYLHYTQPESFPAGSAGRHLDVSQPVQVPDLPTLHRFYIDGTMDVTMQCVRTILESMAVMFQMKKDAILFLTTDTKRNKLGGEIIVQEAKGSSIVTIKRTKGDLMEFKKFILYFSQEFN